MARTYFQAIYSASDGAVSETMSEVFQALRRQLAGDGVAAYRIGLPVDIGPHRIDLLAGAAMAIARYRMQGLSVSGHWVDDGRQPGPAREAAQAHSRPWNAC